MPCVSFDTGLSINSISLVFFHILLLSAGILRQTFLHIQVKKLNNAAIILARFLFITLSCANSTWIKFTFTQQFFSFITKCWLRYFHIIQLCVLFRSRKTSHASSLRNKALVWFANENLLLQLLLELKVLHMSLIEYIMPTGQPRTPCNWWRSLRYWTIDSISFNLCSSTHHCSLH